MVQRSKGFRPKALQTCLSALFETGCNIKVFSIFLFVPTLPLMIIIVLRVGGGNKGRQVQELERFQIIGGGENEEHILDDNDDYSFSHRLPKS
jgi:hypothetical protein